MNYYVFGDSTIGPFICLRNIGHREINCYKFKGISMSGIIKKNNTYHNKIKYILSHINLNNSSLIFNFGFVDVAFIIFYYLIKYQSLNDIINKHKNYIIQYVKWINHIKCKNKFIISAYTNSAISIPNYLENYGYSIKQFEINPMFNILCDKNNLEKYRRMFNILLYNECKKYQNIHFIDTDTIIFKNNKIKDIFINKYDNLSVHLMFEPLALYLIDIINKNTIYKISLSEYDKQKLKETYNKYIVYKKSIKSDIL